jgi:hypothetical protein
VPKIPAYAAWLRPEGDVQIANCVENGHQYVGDYWRQRRICHGRRNFSSTTIFSPSRFDSGSNSRGVTTTAVRLNIGTGYPGARASQ